MLKMPRQLTSLFFFHSAIMAVLFTYVYYRNVPHEWGDVMQALKFHQVRKYLLQLDFRVDHVKFWRPSVLLLTLEDAWKRPPSSEDPGVGISHAAAPAGYPRGPAVAPLARFADALKKSGLYTLGSVVPTRDGKWTGLDRQVVARVERLRSWMHSAVKEQKWKALVQAVPARGFREGAASLMMVNFSLIFFFFFSFSFQIFKGFPACVDEFPLILFFFYSCFVD
jgi:hypothetical protein